MANTSIHEAAERIKELEQENMELKQCIEDLVSTKISLQRKALKSKTNIVKAQAIEEMSAELGRYITKGDIAAYAKQLRQSARGEE